MNPKSRYSSLLIIVITIALGSIAPAPLLALDENPWDSLPIYTEEFENLEVSSWGKDGSKWLAHTPWNGDFGEAKFVYDDKNNPFHIESGLLTITARKDYTGKWSSGLLALNMNSDSYKGHETGYFETRMKLPRGDGLWPAFWLIGENRELFTAEIDIFEYYGRWPEKFSTNVHVWRKHKGGKNNSKHYKFKAEFESLNNKFNLYGVHITADELVFYFNRKEFWRVEKPKEFNGMNFYPLINLAMTKYNVKLDKSSYMLEVDYVRVYE